ncbi:MBL fold metallo-hydrolase [Ovoidimarina sediminis]|uniref:MBL fold metallo-hydrolase n=1 Tax=Ovoidimarina sediminis TaxID=3079856 RepID=UPI00290E5F6F|nr:MBL fold metallo-hydrolase [Rhodophyticola sp. MJ-SS7]MDU8942211.1 MBL fold metallo-hydrolase [Rhodophyticola sp. MJ-SS7]
MKLTVLGSGSPEAYERRASSGYLIEVAGQRILFDCGGGVFDRLLKAGLKPTDIDYIFFSHLHSDHMMDYARLVHAAWDEGGRLPKVYGPAPIASITEKLFGKSGVFAHDLEARTGLKGSKEVWLARGGTLPRPWPAPEVTEVEPRFRVDGDGWRLSSCPVPHAQPFLECMAFAVEADGARFVYSGDAGITPEFESFVSGADFLLHWCYRLSDETNVSEFYKHVAPTPAEIAAMASRNGVGELVITHFRVHMDAPERHAAALKELQSGFPGNSSIAEDLDAFTITPRG